jgi:DNA-binding FadR family transcriptional regulator
MEKMKIRDESPLVRFSTSEAVVNFFKNKIKEGSIIAGDKLPSERQLQEQLGISRFSLREGLARLRALGIIRIIHGKGAFVSDIIDSTSLSDVLSPHLLNPNTNSYAEFFEARITIEEKVVYLAAKRRSNVDLKSIEQILDQAEENAGNADEYGELGFLFHDRIALAAGNIFFKKMLDVINNHLRIFLYDSAKLTADRKKSLLDHWEIYECIKNRDGSKAAKLIRAHIEKSRKIFESSFKRPL